ncbi:MAG: hypothetical protein PHG80_11595 [Methanoregulaceae archaeon]|nr:hypothetical protein [Methanoregulaceae archaeon]
MSVTIVVGRDSGAIDERIRELYLQGVKVAEIPKDPEVGIGYGPVTRRLTRLRRQGAIGFRIAVKQASEDVRKEGVFLCPRCRSAFDSRIEAEMCCAPQAEFDEFVRRFWP